MIAIFLHSLINCKFIVQSKNYYMKKALHLLFLSLLAVSLFGQAVLVNSPASIARSYLFGTAGQGTANLWGADLLSNVWTADAVLIQTNGTSPTLGCDTITNKAALVGKIVLIDRGTCNFSFKALNAQNYGAIACVILNNVPGGAVQEMGAGTFGASVTIPVVLLSYEDGLSIKNELKNGPVNMTIGNYRFMHDIGTNSRRAICNPPFGTYPASWVKNLGDFAFIPAASVTNKGTNVESAVKINTKVDFTATGGSTNTIYDKTSDGSVVLEVDSSRDIILDAFDLFGKISSNITGRGTINYTASLDKPDDSPFDNLGTSSFALSPNLLSKARLNTNGRDPMFTNAYQRSDGAQTEYLAAFNLKYGQGCKVDSVLYYMSFNAPATLADKSPEAILYLWDDVDNDGNITNAELSFAALGTYTFPSNETRSGAIVAIPLEDFNTSEPGFVIPNDNTKVVLGVRYGGTELPFFGFDEGFDFRCSNDILIANGQFSDLDYPYIGATQYDSNTGVPDVDGTAFLFTNNRAALAATLVMSGSCFIVGAKNLNGIDAQIEISPNPAQDFISVKVQLEETSTLCKLRIYDNFGKVLYSSTNNTTSNQYSENIKLNNFVSGNYYLQIVTDKGQKSILFNVEK